jgi:plastocyanin
MLTCIAIAENARCMLHTLKGVDDRAMQLRLPQPGFLWRVLTALVLSVTGISATRLPGLWNDARPAAAQGTTGVQVYASGLINPKQLVFTQDGTLYVAEAGQPGDVTVPLPAGFGGKGPIGNNGRISRIRPGGQREDFVTGLPNIGLYNGVEMLGASGLAVLDGQLYEVAAGHLTVSPALSRVSADGRMSAVADVGEFNNNNPAPKENGDAVLRGNPFGMTALQGNLYITDGNYNRIIKAGPSGQLSLLIQLPTDPTTTGIAAGPDGNLYVAQFGQAPYAPGTGHIDRVTPDGQLSEGVVKNLTTPIDVAFAPDGTMYVLQYAAEFSADKLRYVALGGEVQRVNPDGSTQAIVTRLMFPTAMTFGPDGALYVTNYGNEANNGEGQVLRVVLGGAPAQGPAVPAPDEAAQYVSTQPTPRYDTGAVAAVVTIVEPSDPQQWGYEPRETTIDVGQAVTITNSGRVSHTATASNGAFDTGLIAGGSSATLRFDTPGTYSFFCQPHPWMKATILVRGQAGVVPPPVQIKPAATPASPSINPFAAVGFVVAIIGVLYLAGFAIRRRTPEAAPQPPDGKT